MLDVENGTPEADELIDELRNADSTIAKGTFALACVGNDAIRPFIRRDNVYIFILNNFLAFPGAWTIGGILDGVAEGGGGSQIHRKAARAFATGQEVGMGWAKKSFSYGPSVE